MTNHDTSAHLDYIRDQRRNELALMQRTWRNEWIRFIITGLIIGLASLWMVNKASAQSFGTTDWQTIRLCQGQDIVTGEPFGCYEEPVLKPTPQAKPVSKKLYAAFLGMDALNETLTLVNMHHGFHELNPAYPQHNIAGHIATFAVYNALNLYAIKRVEKKSRLAATIILVSAIGVQGYVSAWEVRNMR